MWLAYFEEAISDDAVEDVMPITKHRSATGALEVGDGHAPTSHHRRKTDHK
jgi:hypothetical protein